jgi:hypothetical protein
MQPFEGLTAEQVGAAKSVVTVVGTSGPFTVQDALASLHQAGLSNDETMAAGIFDYLVTTGDLRRLEMETPRWELINPPSH